MTISGFLSNLGYAIPSVPYDIIARCGAWYQNTAENRHVRVNGKQYDIIPMGFGKRACADDANLCEVLAKLNADARYRRALAKNTLEYKRGVIGQFTEANRAGYISTADVMKQAGDMAFHGDLRVWQQAGASLEKPSALGRLVTAMTKVTQGEMRNLTRTTGFRLASGTFSSSRRAFLDAMNLALAKVTGGVSDFNSAASEVVRELAKSGLRTVSYQSGREFGVDVAARLGIRTAAAQLSGKVTMQNVKSTGVTHVEVSAHTGARTGEGHANHAGWQGKVYQVEGSSPGYPNLQEATGYPSDPLGLLGYNCRHQFYPFWIGIDSPASWDTQEEPREYGGRSYTEYQATQRQRSMERDIRALKREASAMEAAGDQERLARVAAKLKTREAEYKRFSEGVGVRAKVERCRVEGYNRSVSGRATAAAKKVEQTNAAKAAIRPLIGKHHVLHIPPTPIVPESLTFDAVHVNIERGRSITILDAQRYVKEAKLSVKVWGPYERYIGENGAAYVNMEEKEIRTAFPAEDYNDTMKKIMEEAKKHGI